MKILDEVPSLRDTRFNLEAPMTASRRISIKLTDDQQQELERATGKTGTAIELGVEELEERIVPSFISPTVGSGLADPRPSPMLGGNWVMVK